MARKVILDVDPGIDDALVLCVALFDPAVEVVAITSVGGEDEAAVTARNLMGIVEFLDPPKLPRIGVGTDPEEGLPFHRKSIHGIDLAEGNFLPVAELCSPTPAEKVICDTIRNHPNDITLLALGPLTNVAKAFRRDPEIPLLLNRLFISGGTFESPGNSSPVAEFNMFCDPKSAQTVFAAGCTKTLVPLDVSCRMKFSLDHFASLPAKESRLGGFLHHILPPPFRAYRRERGMEQIYLQEMIAYFAMTMPELFETQDVAGDVETGGRLTRGQTVFDRRKLPQWRKNMEVVSQIDPKAVCDQILEAFRRSDRMITERNGH